MVRFVYLPVWKAYLYDLKRRIEIFRMINSGRLKILGVSDYPVIQRALIKYGRGEKLLLSRAFIYLYYVKCIKENRRRATANELEIAIKLTNITKLSLETIFMEMKELKKFAKEVGLDVSELKGLDEEEMCKSIIAEIDPEANYSDEFVEWYEGLDEALFEEDEEDEKPTKKEKKSKKKVVDEDEDEKPVKKEKKSKKPETNWEEIQDQVEECETIKELRKVMDQYEVFPEKFSKMKNFDELQEAMIEFIEEKTGGDEKETEETFEVASAIADAEDVDDLKTIYKENEDLFESVSIRGKIKFGTLKKNMLEALGHDAELEDDEEETPTPKKALDFKKKKKVVEEDEDEKPLDFKKKKKAKKESEVDIDELTEEWEAMPIGKLKSAAKKLGLKIKPGVTKKATIALMVEKVEEDGFPEVEEPVEINQSLVLSMVKTKDLDGLLGIAKELEIKVGVMEKKSVKKLGERLIEELTPDEDTVKSKKDSETKKRGRPAKKIVEVDEEDEEEETPYQMVERMLEKGRDDDFIIKKMVPVFIEKGKDKIYARKRTKQLIEIIKEDME